jgi:predicted HicB family RNase H-like nuclease
MTDDRKEVELDLEDTELFNLMLMAHNQDITLNQLVEKILQEYIDNHKKITDNIEDNP